MVTASTHAARGSHSARRGAMILFAGVTAGLMVVSAAGEAAHAQTIGGAGVLGNSGRFGPELVRMSPTTQELARPTGLWLDEDGAVWLGAGESIVRLSLDGRLLERRALEGEGARILESERAAVDAENVGGAALVARGVAEHRTAERLRDFAPPPVIQMAGGGARR
jgi:hypothetical protein